MGEAGFTLASFTTPNPGGYVWQDWAYQSLIAFGARATQGPGTLALFGYPSASGIRHEIDAAGIGDLAVVLEAKDQKQSISKEQVDSFHGRTLDYFEGGIQRGFSSDLYRMIWSTGDIDIGIRRYAARLGIILVGSDKAPLPVLLAAAEEWDAIEWMSNQYLGDLVLLGERACRPLHAETQGQSLVYPYQLNLWNDRDLDDLDYLQDLASAQWLDWIDNRHPLHLERIAANHLSHVSI